MKLLAEHSVQFNPHQPWEELRETTRGQSRLFHQIGALRRSPHTGREHEFTRLLCPDWVNVIALLPSGELLAVEQFRHGVDASTLEIVGGVCDPGEEPLFSAKRELQEETGHISDHWVPLGDCAPNPAVQDNHCHFFLALDCQSIGQLKLDPSEELRVWALSWREWEAKLKAGEIVHSLVLTAFFKLFLWEGWPGLKARLEAC